MLRSLVLSMISTSLLMALGLGLKRGWLPLRRWGDTWPQIMFYIEDLFTSAILKKTMTVHHPKIIALKLELENNRQHIDVKPLWRSLLGLSL